MSYIFKNINDFGEWVGIITDGTFIAPGKPITAYFKLFTESSDNRIKQTFCDISILADEQNTFDDLNTENERQIDFKLSLNGTNIFTGWINPDGIFQNQVSSKWYITLRATDGLDALQNLAYVTTGGLKYMGYTTPERIVSQALLRLRNGRLRINNSTTSVTSNFYLGYLSGVLDFVESFWRLKFNQDLFFDGEDIDTCTDVIEEVLELCNCVLFHFNGQWQILHEFDYSNSSLDAKQLKSFSYALGAGVTVTEEFHDFNYEIGPRSKNFQYYFVNANQRTNTVASIGAVRYAFDFGDFVPVTTNPNLEHNGSSFDGFTLLSNFDNLFFLEGNSGVVVGYLGNDEGNYEPYFISDPVDVEVNERFTVNLEWFNKGVFLHNDTVPATNIQTNRVFLQVIHTSATNTKSWFDGSVWVEEGSSGYNFTTSFPHIVFTVNGVNTSVTSALENIIAPSDGQIQLLIFRLDIRVASPMGPIARLLVKINLLSIVFTAEDDGSVGVEHTAQQTNRLTSVIREVKTVSFSNSEQGQLQYNGTLLNKNDQVLLEDFVVTGDATPRPLLRVLTEELVREKQTPLIRYSGDVRGYIPRIARVRIYGFDNPFKVVSTSYDSQRDISALVLEEVKPQPRASEGIRYSRQLKFSETIKPTIV